MTKPPTIPQMMRQNIRRKSREAKAKAQEKDQDQACRWQRAGNSAHDGDHLLAPGRAAHVLNRIYGADIWRVARAVQKRRRIAQAVEPPLHPQWSDQRIAQIATTRGITASALSGFCAGPSDLNGLVIGYCGFTTSEIQRGLTILEDVLKGCSNGRLHHR